MEKFKGHVIDVVKAVITDAEIVVSDGVVESVTPCVVPVDAPYYLPGFVDSHVHVESSMMLPSEFARIACKHGTVAAVCDPHEIANVLGVKGIELMLEDASRAGFHFAFCAPSCVPSCSSDMETSGAVLDSHAIAQLMKRDDIYALAEMMNYPGVLGSDPEVLAKIAAAKSAGKPVDGHAPGLTGEQRRLYAQAGISTDHECSTLEEARDAVNSGMKILIREGSAAKNYDALAPLVAECPDSIMFCTDDSHPTDLVTAHIDKIVRSALADGYPLMNVLRAACLNPVQHYNLPSGLLREGDPADFISISDITPQFRVLATYINGRKAEDFEVAGPELDTACMQNICTAGPLSVGDICGPSSDGDVHQIVAQDRSLLTGHYFGPLDSQSQKIVVYNRYVPGAVPQVSYIRGFNIASGAVAQSIAHDCHNIIAIGHDDENLVKVINRLVELGGGIVVTDGDRTEELPLPVAGLMSTLPGEELAAVNLKLESLIKKAGCTMVSPFITLAFMALPVIPELKLTDKGLFDSTTWSFIR